MQNMYFFYIKYFYHIPNIYFGKNLNVNIHIFFNT